MALTKTEIRELKPIVRRRKDKILRELGIRKRELEEYAIRYLTEENQAEIDHHSIELASIAKELEPLHARMRKLQEKVEEKGLALAGGRTTYDSRYDSYVYVPSLQGVTIKLDTRSKKREIRELQDKIEIAFNRARNKIINDVEQFLDDLTLQAVDSDEAKEFIQNLPTIDSFLPLPNGKPLMEILDGDLVTLEA